MLGPALLFFHCCTLCSVHRSFFCIGCDSCSFGPACIYIFIVHFTWLFTCLKSQVPPIKCKSWLCPLEPDRYALLGITKSILSPRGVEESPLGLPACERMSGVYCSSKNLSRRGRRSVREAASLWECRPTKPSLSSLTKSTVAVIWGSVCKSVIM